jgi:predicted nucleotidyltransferase
MTRFGLREGTIAKIKGVLAAFPEVEKAVLYGSRAKGNYKPGSDIDLTLFGEGLDQRRCDQVAEALDDLLLPYMIDLSVYALLHHPELEAHIERVGQVFYERSAGPSQP